MHQNNSLDKKISAYSPLGLLLLFLHISDYFRLHWSVGVGWNLWTTHTSISGYAAYRRRKLFRNSSRFSERRDGLFCTCNSRQAPWLCAQINGPHMECRINNQCFQISKSSLKYLPTQQTVRLLRAVTSLHSRWWTWSRLSADPKL